MKIGRILARLGFASLVSSAMAAASVLLIVLVLEEPSGFSIEAFKTILFVLPIAAVLGILFAGPPAWLFGGILWGLGTSNPDARHPAAWAAAGAGTGWLVFLLLGMSLGGMPAPILPFIVTGAACALLFRWLMRVTEPASPYSGSA